MKKENAEPSSVAKELGKNWLLILAVAVVIVGITLAFAGKFYLPATIGLLGFGQVLKILHDFKKNRI